MRVTGGMREVCEAGSRTEAYTDVLAASSRIPLSLEHKASGIGVVYYEQSSPHIHNCLFLKVVPLRSEFIQSMKIASLARQHYVLTIIRQQHIADMNAAFSQSTWDALKNECRRVTVVFHSEKHVNF